MTHNLKPCPVCGGEALLCYNKPVSLPEMHWFICRDCHASPGSRASEALAAEAWNAMPADVETAPIEADYDIARIANERWGAAINGPQVAVIAAQMARQRECRRIRGTRMGAAR